MCVGATHLVALRNDLPVGQPALRRSCRVPRQGNCEEMTKRFEERELIIVDVAREGALDVFGAWTSLAGHGTY